MKRQRDEVIEDPDKQLKDVYHKAGIQKSEVKKVDQDEQMQENLEGEPLKKEAVRVFSHYWLVKRRTRKGAWAIVSEIPTFSGDNIQNILERAAWAWTGEYKLILYDAKDHRVGDVSPVRFIIPEDGGDMQKPVIINRDESTVRVEREDDTFEKIKDEKAKTISMLNMDRVIKQAERDLSHVDNAEQNQSMKVVVDSLDKMQKLSAEKDAEIRAVNDKRFDDIQRSKEAEMEHKAKQSDGQVSTMKVIMDMQDKQNEFQRRAMEEEKNKERERASETIQAAKEGVKQQSEMMQMMMMMMKQSADQQQTLLASMSQKPERSEIADMMPLLVKLLDKPDTPGINDLLQSPVLSRLAEKVMTPKNEMAAIEKLLDSPITKLLIEKMTTPPQSSPIEAILPGILETVTGTMGRLNEKAAEQILASASNPTGEDPLMKKMRAINFLAGGLAPALKDIVVALKAPSPKPQQPQQAQQQARQTVQHVHIPAPPPTSESTGLVPASPHPQFPGQSPMPGQNAPAPATPTGEDLPPDMSDILIILDKLKSDGPELVFAQLQRFPEIVENIRAQMGTVNVLIEQETDPDLKVKLKKLLGMITSTPVNQ